MAGGIKRKKAVFLAALLLLGAALALSVCIGKYPISLPEIGTLLTGGTTEEMTRNVFFTLRLPRTAMVLIAGVGLGTAGFVFQTIFKNPLASPDVIGVTSGASVGAAVVIVFVGGGAAAVTLGAFLGGIGAVACLLALVSLTNGRNTGTFLLGGIVINSLTQAVIMLLKSTADPERQLAAIEFWIMGSFGSVTGDKVLSILPTFIIGLLGLFLLRWQVILLSLSDDEGTMLGVRVRLARCAVLVCATLVVASVVSVSGLVMFIGLLAPHIARLLLGKNDFSSAVLGGIAGAVLLLCADCIARSIGGGEVPISILTSLLGAPVLAYLVCKRRVSL